MTGAHHDYSALKWLDRELGETLNQARVALQEFVEGEGTSSTMDSCADFTHQVQGILQMVQVHGAMLLAREIELSVRMLAAGNIEGDDEENAETIMMGLIRLPDYLEQVQADNLDNPLLLRTTINELREQRKEPLLDDRQLLGVRFEGILNASSAKSKPNPKLPKLAKAIRPRLQKGMLSWIRATDIEGGLGHIKKVMEVLERSAGTDQVAKIFRIVRAALVLPLKDPDKSGAAVKKLFAKVDQVIKRLVQGGEKSVVKKMPMGLLHSLLFEVALSGVDDEELREISTLYGLGSIKKILQNSPESNRIRTANRDMLDSFKEAMAEDLTSIKDKLDLFIRSGSTDPNQLSFLEAPLRTVADTLAMIDQNDLRERLLKHADLLKQTAGQGRLPGESDLMSMAGDILYVETSIENLTTSTNTGDSNKQTGFEEDNALDLPSGEYEKLVRSVVEQSAIDMRKCKEAILLYLKNQNDIEPLSQVPTRFSTVSGAFEILQISEAAALVKKLADFVSVQIVARRVHLDKERMNVFADSVTSIEYFMETMVEGRGIQKNIISFANQSLDDLIEMIGAEDNSTKKAALNQQASEISLELGDIESLMNQQDEEIGLDEIERAENFDVQDEEESKILDEVDPEILEVFIEEAREEMEVIREFFPRWKNDRSDVDALATFRRSFHTLKGSGRLVGAKVIGELAWSIENLLNRIMEQTVSVSAEVVDIIQEASGSMPALIECFENGREPKFDVDALYDKVVALADPQEKRPKRVAEPKIVEEVKSETVDLPATPDDLVSEQLELPEAVTEPEIRIEAISSESEQAAEISNQSETIPEVAVKAKKEPIVVLEDVDPEILEIFIEEAKEQLEIIGEHYPLWKENNSNSESLTLFRRSFHTLKGSGRMVGAVIIGELAWTIENLLNKVIDGVVDVSPLVLEVIDETIAHLPHLIDCQECGKVPEINVQALSDRAEAVAKPGGAEEIQTAGESLQSLVTGVGSQEPAPSDIAKEISAEQQPEDLLALNVDETAEDSFTIEEDLDHVFQEIVSQGELEEVDEDFTESLEAMDMAPAITHDIGDEFSFDLGDFGKVGQMAGEAEVRLPEEANLEDAASARLSGVDIEANTDSVAGKSEVSDSVRLDFHEGLPDGDIAVVTDAKVDFFALPVDDDSEMAKERAALEEDIAKSGLLDDAVEATESGIEIDTFGGSQPTESVDLDLDLAMLDDLERVDEGSSMLENEDSFSDFTLTGAVDDFELSAGQSEKYKEQTQIDEEDSVGFETLEIPEDSTSDGLNLNLEAGLQEPDLMARNQLQQDQPEEQDHFALDELSIDLLDDFQESASSRQQPDEVDKQEKPFDFSFEEESLDSVKEPEKPDLTSQDPRQIGKESLELDDNSLIEDIVEVAEPSLSDLDDDTFHDELGLEGLDHELIGEEFAASHPEVDLGSGHAILDDFADLMADETMITHSSSLDEALQDGSGGVDVQEERVVQVENPEEELEEIELTGVLDSDATRQMDELKSKSDPVESALSASEAWGDIALDDTDGFSMDSGGMLEPPSVETLETGQFDQQGSGEDDLPEVLVSEEFSMQLEDEHGAQGSSFQSENEKVKPSDNLDLMGGDLFSDAAESGETLDEMDGELEFSPVAENSGFADLDAVGFDTLNAADVTRMAQKSEQILPQNADRDKAKDKVEGVLDFDDLEEQFDLELTGLMNSQLNFTSETLEGDEGKSLESVVSSIVLDETLQEIFTAESHNHISALKDFLARCGGTNAPCEVNENVLRALHTLRGSAHMAEVDPISDISGAMEGYAKALAALGEPAEELFMSLLTQAVSVIEKVLSIINQPGASLPDWDEMTGKARERQAELVAQSLAQVNAANSKASSKTNLPLDGQHELSEEFTRLNISTEESGRSHSLELAKQNEQDIFVKVIADDELIEVFVEEAEELLDILNQTLVGWLEEPENLAPIAELQRTLHTLKGSSRLAGIAPIGDLSDSLESLLVGVRQKKLISSREIIGFCQVITDKLLNQLEEVRNLRKVRHATELVGVLAELLAGTVSVDSLNLGQRKPTNEPSNSAEFEILSSATPETPLPEHVEEEPSDDPELELLDELEIQVLDDSESKLFDDAEIQFTAESEKDQLATAELEFEVQPEIEKSAEKPIKEQSSEEMQAKHGESQDILLEETLLKLDADPELTEIFLEEAQDLVDALDQAVHEWRADSSNHAHLADIQRTLHTLKGSSRLVGVTPVGDLSHAFESLLVAVKQQDVSLTSAVLALSQEVCDSLVGQIAQVKDTGGVETANALIQRISAAQKGEAFTVEAAQPETRKAQILEPSPSDPAKVENAVSGDSSESPTEADNVKHEEKSDTKRGKREQVRVRPELLDNLVNYSGEISIYRGRLEQQNSSLGFNLQEMIQTVGRLRGQLRSMDIETEAQIISRYEKDVENREDEVEKDFDPLEMDQFSSMQQLSRALGETVNDLSNINESLETLHRGTDTLLLQQSRVSVDLQDGLMRTRMVNFSQIIPRLRRLIRQTCASQNKQAELEVVGGEAEIDRNILDRVLGPIEHLLRNSVTHGIESPEERIKKGKNEVGKITFTLTREGNDVVIEISDDGAGLDLKRIREKAINRKLLAAGAKINDEELMQFILEPGFSTADQIDQIAGRGVGMDVVTSEVKQMGGTLKIQSEWQKGAKFILSLPLTLAVTNSLLIRLGEEIYSVPHAGMEGVIRISRDDLLDCYEGRKEGFEYAGNNYVIRYLGGILGTSALQLTEQQRWFPLLLVRAGEHRVGLQVDELLGNREVVVKPLGTQLNGLRWLSGGTILPDGQVALILDAPAVARIDAAQTAFTVVSEDSLKKAKRDKIQVMVVDDSITVRKVTTRFLNRHNMDVVTAKDGIDAVAQLLESQPDIILLDVEMPRMDGYEVARHVKHSDDLRHIPIIMITSRTGKKHRNVAMELGVERYLGKPFQEVDLLEAINELVTLGVEA